MEVRDGRRFNSGEEPSPCPLPWEGRGERHIIRLDTIQVLESLKIRAHSPDQTKK